MDEKYPFLVFNIVKTGVPTVVLLDGKGYKATAKKWLQEQAGPKRPVYAVWDMSEFHKAGNNGFLGMVRQWQQFFYNGRYSATPLKNPDFVKLAEAYGAGATRVHSRRELLKAVDAALGSDVLQLIVAEMPQGFASFV